MVGALLFQPHPNAENWVTRRSAHPTLKTYRNDTEHENGNQCRIEVKIGSRRTFGPANKVELYSEEGLFLLYEDVRGNNPDELNAEEQKEVEAKTLKFAKELMKEMPSFDEEAMEKVTEKYKHGVLHQLA